MIDVVVLAGGAGENLWPISRQKMPKQFLKLLNNETSLFQNTLLRINELIKSVNDIEFKVTVICNDSNKFMVKDELKEILPNVEHIIISEPVNKNTTAAITVALELAQEDSHILILPSDQIWDNNDFCKCVKTLINENKDCISMIGITPYYPATRFGYIHVKDNELLNFVEKPNKEEATEYVNKYTTSYLWNSGVLFSKRKVLHNEIKTKLKIIPEIKKVIDNSDFNNNILSLNKGLFSNVDSISIEYSILEKYKNGYVIKYDSYWTDIDGFKSLFDFHKKDKDYNLIHSKKEDNILTLDTINSYIYSENKLVTTLGVSDLVIIDTYDSLLVANKESSQKVPSIVNILKSQSRSEHIVNPICYKPWGWYLNFDGNDYCGYRVKKICIYPSNRMSLQSHKERSEHWTIIKGEGKAQIGDDTFFITVNQNFFIPRGVKHRLENIGDENLELIETQIGSYLGEDDIVRYEDDFGR